MNNLQVFESYEVRFVEHPEGNYDFGIVAADLASVLCIKNTADMVKYVDVEWRGIDSVYTPGGIQSMIVVWEPGIYQVLAKSRRPQAKQFQKWLFEEVVPNIRKTGSYNLQDKTSTVPTLPKRDAVEYIIAATNLEALQDSTLKTLLKDSLIEELELNRNQKALPGGDKKTYTIVKVRAKELGYTAKEIGNGSALGRFVASQVQPAYREMIGRYPVYHYEVTPELDTAIHTYFGG